MRVLACGSRSWSDIHAIRRRLIELGPWSTIAVDTWPSSGLLLHGFEIKVSRSDWRRELAQPWKAEPFLRRVDRFWVVAPSGVVRTDELPDRWGLLEQRGKALRATVTAQQLDPEPIDRGFVACLLRAATTRTPEHVIDLGGAA